MRSITVMVSQALRGIPITSIPLTPGCGSAGRVTPGTLTGSVVQTRWQRQWIAHRSLRVADSCRGRRRLRTVQFGRSQPGDSRNLDHVPLEEIANAMAVVAELGGGMNEEELKREALALFGGKRMTEGISTRLDQGLNRGLTTGRIEQDARGLIVPVL